MQSYSDQKKEEIRHAADIVQVIGEHVQFKRAGANYTGLCPFHSEKTPSFTVFPQTQSFHCFGCGESGDVFAFLMKQQHLSFPEAMRELAECFGVELPSPQQTKADQRQDLLRQINAEAARLFHEHLSKSLQAEAARQYLQQRGVPQEFIATYQLGYAPDEWEFLSSRLKQFPADAVEQAGLIVRRQSGKGFYDRFRNRIMFPVMNTGGAHRARSRQRRAEVSELAGKPDLQQGPPALRPASAQAGNPPKQPGGDCGGLF